MILQVGTLDETFTVGENISDHAAKRLVKWFLQHAISNGQIDTQKRSKV